jgi:hypothetical protein
MYHAITAWEVEVAIEKVAVVVQRKLLAPVSSVMTSVRLPRRRASSVTMLSTRHTSTSSGPRAAWPHPP